MFPRALLLLLLITSYPVYVLTRLRLLLRLFPWLSSFYLFSALVAVLGHRSLVELLGGVGLARDLCYIYEPAVLVLCSGRALASLALGDQAEARPLELAGPAACALDVPRPRVRPRTAGAPARLALHRQALERLDHMRARFGPPRMIFGVERIRYTTYFCRNMLYSEFV